MCWSSGMAYGPTHRVSCPSRSLNLVCKIPTACLVCQRLTPLVKVAAPGLGLSGSVCVIAAAATRLHTYSAAELAPENVRAWQELRQARETRRQQRTLRRRFRRDPAAYLAQLEANVLQLILPP